MTLGPGELVGGKYRIVRLIGDGGMGSVYEARHELLGAPVALKFLHAELAKRPGLSARFLQEARVSATIQSPHVTRVTDVDTTVDGSPYLVMELLNGESLQSLLDRRGKLPQAQAIDFTLQILAGLEAAHALGVVHRDLKPDNVFVTPTAGGPFLKLIDFGIAKLRETNEYKKGLTRAGVVMGTAEYMAPEQLYSASEVDHRADIYSLGVMLFEMLSGARPADGESAEAIIANVLSGKVRRLHELAPELPPGLVAIVEATLQGDRERRPASAYDLRVALSGYAGELSHAGRLAVASARVAPSASRLGEAAMDPQPKLPDTAYGPPPDLGKVPDTVDAPAPAVPRTLPPDDRALMPAVVPPLVGAQPHRGRKRRRRGRFWLIALVTLVVLGITGLVVARIVERERRPNAVSQNPTIDVPPPVKTIEPIVIPTPTETPASPRTETPTPRPRPQAQTPTPSRPPETNTAAGGAAPTLQPLPFPSFALPSSLPPLPSTFPALPTALPSFFPQIPGLTPPGASPAAGGAPGQ